MTKLKLCGMRRPEDIAMVGRHQPDMIGFIFVPGRRRTISFEQARALKTALAPGIKAVGVFAGADIKTIQTAVADGIIDGVQLHGGEDEPYIKTLKASVDAPVIKAFSVQNADDIARANESFADMVLLDCGRGGSGECFDWDLLEGVRRPYILAGGINPENLAAALEKKPYAVDISSGVETDGVKDEAKIAACVAMVDDFNRKETNMDLNNVPNARGRYGDFGGQYVPETLMNELIRLEKAYKHYMADPDFRAELKDLMVNYAGRPSLLYEAKNMTADLGGAKVYLKREDLNHTGAHKINNVLGQCLLAKKMGKTRIIAETGAGQHGVAAATACALLGMECEVFMGKLDTERQALNVYRMELLGAKVHPVTTGTMTLKDAVNEAMREWASRVDDTHYALGSVMGPHPFPMIVRDFQSVIGNEARKQILEAEGKLPAAVLACVGGGSNAIGMFHAFVPDKDVRLIGCEAAGRGVDTDKHAATMAKGTLGIFHGMKSYFCQNEDGQIAPVYSISAGLDYPGIGPEHAYLRDIGRAEYVPVTDDEAVDAFEYLAKTEGIICAIESAHAVAQAIKLAPTLPKDENIIICLSGRGDKDVAAIARYRGHDISD